MATAFAKSVFPVPGGPYNKTPTRRINTSYIPYIDRACIPPRGGGYSYILAIQVCTAGEGMVFKPFSLV